MSTPNAEDIKPLETEKVMAIQSLPIQWAVDLDDRSGTVAYNHYSDDISMVWVLFHDNLDQIERVKVHRLMNVYVETDIGDEE